MRKITGNKSIYVLFRNIMWMWCTRLKMFWTQWNIFNLNSFSTWWLLRFKLLRLFNGNLEKLSNKKVCIFARYSDLCTCVALIFFREKFDSVVFLILEMYFANIILILCLPLTQSNQLFCIKKSSYLLKFWMCCISICFLRRHLTFPLQHVETSLFQFF